MAQIDFKEARRLVDLTLRPDWDPSAGSFYVAPWGYQDAWGYQVIVGAQEFLEDGNDLYAGTDDTVILVTKAGGKVRLESFLELEVRLAAMTPVGEGHPA